MKRLFSPMKIPHKMWLFVILLSVEQIAFPSDLSDAPVNAVTQQKITEVTGIVSDTFGTVFGASVRIKGTTIGVITDVNGGFKLQVPVGATLIISYVGYTNKVISYKGEKNLKITLDENVQQLQEVQVIAYGTTKKVTVTGSMSSVNSEELLKTPAANLGNALSGKVTGLSTIQSTGQPGADAPSIYVRGVGSLSESLSKPLMLVDGVERSFFQLDPNEIEDITVLKDASATAVFGVRGANGVIIVTTKRGKEGKAKVSFSTSFAVQAPTRMPQFANSYDYATTYNNAQRHDGVPEGSLAFSDDAIEAFRTHSHPMAYPDTDWVDMLIKKTALQTQHNVTISGGTNKIRYFASLGVFTQDGLFRSLEKEYNSNFNYNRYNYRVNLDIDVTKTTLMAINLGGRVDDRRSPNYEGNSDIGYLFRDIYWATPFAGVGVVDGKWIVADSKKIANMPGAANDALYPYYGKGYNTSAGNTLNFDFVLEQKLDIITKGLKAHVKGSYNSRVTQNKFRGCSFPKYDAILNDDGTIDLKKTGDKTALTFEETMGKSRDWYTEFAVNYKRNFDKHHVSALGMYNQSMSYYPAGSFPGLPTGYVGLVGRATYDFNTRYMVDANIGYNGSENFAPGKRFGLFPAFSLGWILSEEKVMQKLKPFLSYLKLRGSYGIVGNDRTSDNSRYLYLPDSYNPSSGSYNFGTNVSSSISGATESKKGNPSVTWETAAKQNYGTDIYFLDSRLKLNLDYFIEHRKNILTTRSIVPGYLAVSLPTANIGKVDNKGFEVNLNWKDQLHNFNYYFGANLSYAKNKIVFMDEIKYPNEYMQKTGKPVGQQFGYNYDGFFSDEDVKNYSTERGKSIPDHGSSFNPKAGDVKYKDLNEDHKIDNNDVAAIGNPIYPLLTGGLNFGFSYKGFDFSMTWSGATKTSRMLGDVFREPFGATNTRSLVKFMVTDAWTPEKGNSAKAPAISFTNKPNNIMDSDLWMRDASYLRLKNVEIAYSLPKTLLQKMHLQQVRFFASGYNLLTLDKLNIVDPESNPSNQSMYPVVMVFNFGLKLGF